MIQNKLDDLSKAIQATFVFYMIGIAAAGLTILGALATLFSSGFRLIALGNFCIALVRSPSINLLMIY